MKVKDTEAYKIWINNNKDEYGSCVLRYVETWANLMEEKIEKGFSIEEMAEKTSHEADTEGITGFMYGCAVQILYECWIHGETLRVWHNGKYNHSGDGVVNPAILTFKREE